MASDCHELATVGVAFSSAHCVNHRDSFNSPAIIASVIAVSSRVKRDRVTLSEENARLRVSGILVTDVAVDTIPYPVVHAVLHGLEIFSVDVVVTDLHILDCILTSRAVSCMIYYFGINMELYVLAKVNI